MSHPEACRSCGAGELEACRPECCARPIRRRHPDGWTDPGRDVEYRHRWEVLEAEGVRAHVVRCRRLGIRVSFVHVRRELVEMREAFGPERTELDLVP